MRKLFLGLLIPNLSFAANAGEVLENLREVVHPLMSLLLMVSFVSGIFFIFKGIGLLKKFGMQFNQASQPAELSGPLVYLIVGAILIYLPTSTNILLTTIFGTDKSPFPEGGGEVDLTLLGQGADILFDQAAPGLDGNFVAIKNTIVLYIQLVGFIAFLRGWFAIAHSGQPGVQPGTITKGIIHILGGIAAINVVGVFEILEATIT